MKVYFWLPFACLLGLLIGSWGSREEAARLRHETAQVPASPKVASVSGLQTLTQMAHIPDVASKQTARKKSIRKQTSESALAGTQKLSRTEAKIQQPAQPLAAPAANPAVTETDLRLRIEEAKELWKVRMDIARSQVIAELDLEARGKLDAFDQVVGEMNEKIYSVVEEIALGLENQEDMPPELTVKMLAYVGDALADTYDKIGELAPPEKRDFVSRLKLTDLVDPIVAEPLIGVQSKFREHP